MTLASPRIVAFALAVSSLSAVPAPAHAEFIYARLVPGQGLQANGDSSAVDVSSDGRTVVFASGATNWVSGDAYNGNRAVAIDLATGVIEVVSRTQTGTVLRGEKPAVSGNGRYVAFLTLGSPLGPSWQVGRKDRVTGELALVSSSSAGAVANAGTDDDTVSISADGRYVAFESASTNLGVAAGSWPEIFVKDLQTGALEMASVKPDGTPSSGKCTLEPHALTDNGRYLAFVCEVDITGGSAYAQLYVRDLQNDTTELASRVGATGASSTAIVYRPAMSADGRFASFQTRGYGGLGYAAGNVESNSGIYLRDRQMQTTIAIPRPAEIPSTDYDNCGVSAVSNVASVVLSCGVRIGSTTVPQMFLFIPGQGAPTRLTGSAGTPGNGTSGNSIAVNASALSMAFESAASNLDPQDTNGFSDIFVLIEESLLDDRLFANGFEN
jgi:Tol biopolymer transport system component